MNLETVGTDPLSPRAQNIYFKAIIDDIYTRQFECYIANQAIL